MKQRIPLAILMVVLTLVCCLVGPLPRLAFLLLCGLAATWETWTLLSRGHSAYVLILLGFVLCCSILNLVGMNLMGYMVAFFLAVHLILIRGILTYREGAGREALMALTALVYPASLFGALLYRIAARGGLDGLTEDEINGMVRFANKAASITTSRPGAIPAMPVLQEVEEGLK